MLNLEKINIDLKKLPRWTFQLLFLIFALILINIYNDRYPSGVIPPASKDSSVTSGPQNHLILTGKLRITASAMCSDIIDGWPSDLKKTFSRHDGKICCFTLVEGAEGDTFIHHQWVYGNELMADRRLTVESASWRTWSNIQLNPAYTGAWRVDIYADNGEKIYSIPFTVN